MILHLGKSNATVRFSLGSEKREKKYRVKNCASISIVSGVIICKFCNELSPVENGYYIRYVRTLNGKIGVIVINYKCPTCHETMTPELPMVNPYKRYGKDVQRVAIENHIKILSLREVKEQLESDWKLKLARATPWYWTQEYGRRSKEVFEKDIVPKLNRSRKVELDELYVNVSGDTGGILNAMSSETWVNFHSSLHLEVTTNKAEDAYKHLYSQGVNPDTIVTDDNKIYHSIWKYLGAKHLLCEFHLMRSICRASKELEKTSCKKRQEQLLGSIIKNCRMLFSQRKFGEKYTTTNGVERVQRFQRDRTRRIVHFGSEATANNFLDAHRFYQNLKKFSFGKRAGKSPVEHSGFDLDGKDWLEYLGFPKLRLSAEMIY